MQASGLNFRDVLSLLGQYPGTPPLGAECAGRIVRVGANVRELQVGEPVVAIAPNSFCDYLTVPCKAVVKVPDGLSLDEAATIPIAFLTASIALFEIGQLQRGSRVLIHSATGGVGLAAIRLAQAAGAEVFATASESKHETLRQFGIQHVYDSRRAGFADGILRATTGIGVDVVLNTLGPEFLAENLRTLASSGRYVDITKTPRTTVQPALDARCDVVYQTLDLAALLQTQPERIQSDLRPLLDRCAAGQLRPLPSRSYALADAENAFRCMRTARHIGKILLRPAHGTGRSAVTSDALSAPTNKRGDLGIQPDACYLVTGGLGGLGLAVARWLTQHGARHIGLLARRRPTDAEQQQVEILRSAARRLRSYRVTCHVQWTSMRHSQYCAVVESVSPGYSIWLACWTTRSSPSNRPRNVSSRVRCQSRRNLELTPSHAGRLHSTTLFCFRPPPRPSDRLGRPTMPLPMPSSMPWPDYRRAHGLPGQSINWGPWSGIGAAASRDVAQRGDLAGIGMLTPEEGLAILEQTLLADLEQVCAVRLEWEQLPVRWKETSIV